MEYWKIGIMDVWDRPIFHYSIVPIVWSPHPDTRNLNL
jgi:hypothetical protein